MRNWYILQCQTQNFQRVLARISLLNVEYFVPTELKISRRKDCKSYRTTERPLFPGYVFLSFDPESVHTTVFTDIPGARQFIRFGRGPEKVSGHVVEALKCSAHLLVSPDDNAVRCKNVQPDLLNKITDIFSVSCPLTRQTTLLNLIQSDKNVHAMTQQGARIYSKIPDTTIEMRMSA